MSGLCFHPWGEVWFPSAVSAFHCTGSLISQALLCCLVFPAAFAHSLSYEKIARNISSSKPLQSWTGLPLPHPSAHKHRGKRRLSLPQLLLCSRISNPSSISHHLVNDGGALSHPLQPLLLLCPHTRVWPKQHLHLVEEPAVSPARWHTGQRSGCHCWGEISSLAHTGRDLLPVSVGHWQAGRYSKVPFDKGVHKPLKLLITDHCFLLVNGLNKNVCTEAKNAGSEARQHPAMVINTHYTNKLPEWLFPQMSWSYPVHKLFFDAACLSQPQARSTSAQKTSFLLK